MAWRSRSCDLCASAIAASASARLCKSSSVSMRETRRFAGGLREDPAAQVSADRFRLLVFRDPKLNLPRPTRAQRSQLVRQVSEKTIILGAPAVRLTLIEPHKLHICSCLRGAAAPAGATDPSRGRYCRTVWHKNTRSLCIHSRHRSDCIQAGLIRTASHEFWSIQHTVIAVLREATSGAEKLRVGPPTCQACIHKIAACRSNALVSAMSLTPALKRTSLVVRVGPRTGR
jgi:hypothetical protein